MRARAVVTAVIVAGGMSAATALALAPNKGAIYESKSDLSFTVSASGKSLTKFQGPTKFACGVLAPGPAKYPKHAKISHGAFKITSIQPAGSKDSTVITGHFTKGGGVRGSIKVATQCLLPPNFNSGPVKHKTFSWSGTSRPDGSASRYCPDGGTRHLPGFGIFNFTNVIASGTTCKTVLAAIKAATVTPNPPKPPTFATKGWTCTGSAPYKCTRHKAFFTFFDGV
jgi:hypothetical protein